jgi:hypothetical protein
MFLHPFMLTISEVTKWISLKKMKILHVIDLFFTQVKYRNATQILLELRQYMNL